MHRHMSRMRIFLDPIDEDRDNYIHLSPPRQSYTRGWKIKFRTSLILIDVSAMILEFCIGEG